MAENLQHLFIKYLNDSLSAEEARELYEAVIQGVDIAELIPENIFTQSLLMNSDVEVSKEVLYEQLIKKIDLGIPERVPPARHFHLLKTTWVRYAAAILLFIGIGAYFYNKRADRVIVTETLKPSPIQNDFPSGGNKAILTLSDGSTIVLDSAANGRLTRQGNTEVIKLSNGQLAYNAGGSDGTKMLFNTMSTPRGGQYQLHLPDGTNVWLNAASSVTFPTVFSGKERKIRMTGEAYFEVAKDKNKPFYVEVNDTRIEVIGTHFNINAYDDETIMKATLLEGSVKISKGTAFQTLSPGEQAEVSDEIKLRKNADIEQVMAWKNGVFNFNRMRLTEAMRQLSRWYDISVVYGKTLPDITIEGKMGRDLNLSQVLEILSEIGVHYKLDEGKKLIILP